MIDCQHAFALLQEILDKEASQIDENEVRAHLEKCSHCFETFRIEESIQEFLNEKIKSSTTSDSKPEKLESLRLNILNQLDKIDTECNSSQNSAFGTTLKIFLSTAALVLLAGVWYFSNGLYTHNEYYIPIEQAHWAVAENISPYTKNINKTEYLSNVERNFNYAVETSFAGYSFIGGKKDKLMGADVEHLVLSNNNNDDFISVFITSAENIEIPKDLQPSKIQDSEFNLFDHNCRGCRLVFHKIGSLVIITASTNNLIDLTKFIPGQLTI